MTRDRDIVAAFEWLSNNITEIEQMDGIIINGIFHEAVKDNHTDCPDSCSIINECNEKKSGAPCLLFGEKTHFEKRNKTPWEGFVKPMIKMKTLDEKSAEYSARLCNQTGNYSKGEIETAYVIGASDNKQLTEGDAIWIGNMKYKI
jgi:hypothetical protein